VVPARGVEGRAGETLAPRNIGKERLVQKAGGADENVCGIGTALCGLDMPAAAGKTRGDDLLVKANELGEATVARDLLDIGPDLGRRRIFARPVVIGLKREFVLAREDIDEEAGKGVVPPSPADVAGLFIDREIDPGSLQRLGHEQPRHARAGDDNPKFPISHHASPDQPGPYLRSLGLAPKPDNGTLHKLGLPCSTSWKTTRGERR